MAWKRQMVRRPPDPQLLGDIMTNSKKVLAAGEDFQAAANAYRAEGVAFKLDLDEANAYVKTKYGKEID
jgi:hypothetical protein